jgi:hypothetical protein
MAALIDEVEKPAKPLSKARVRTKQVNACESASKVDPCFLGQVNELARRSAFGPHAE